MLDITTIILTYNEEIHIKRCLERITPYVKDVFIIDCFSNDNTLKIVENSLVSGEKFYEMEKFVK